VPALDNPPRDAKLIAAALRDVGFQTVSLSTVSPATSSSRRCARRRRRREKADWAVVYYAGHGFEIGGVNYLVPSTPAAADKECRNRSRGARAGARAVGRRAPAGLVILDACPQQSVRADHCSGRWR